MQKALNDQFNAEYYSAYLYLSMSAYFKSCDLDGFASWMYYQYQEEQMHAMKFYDFICQRGGRVRLDTIEAPQAEWDSPQAVFDATLAHEQKVTGLINGLVDTALAEHDHAASIFLQWFVTEQVEEEENVTGVLNKLRLLKDAPGGIFMLDQELAQRGTPGAAAGTEST